MFGVLSEKMTRDAAQWRRQQRTFRVWRNSIVILTGDLRSRSVGREDTVGVFYDVV
jgi:hypothetical protein